MHTTPQRIAPHSGKKLYSDGWKSPDTYSKGFESLPKTAGLYQLMRPSLNVMNNGRLNHE
jgi:hypothetical protein